MGDTCCGPSLQLLGGTAFLPPLCISVCELVMAKAFLAVVL